MGIYLSTPKTEKFSEDGENGRVRYGLSSMQGWRATMEDAHAAYPDLDTSTSFFGVYDGHGGKVVAKFCAKYLHRQVLKNEAYAAGDIGTSVQKAFFRMDEMMRGQRGWRELAVLLLCATTMMTPMLPLQACMHRAPIDKSERGTQWPEKWPSRLQTPPYWLNSSQMGIYGKPAPQDFARDYEHCFGCHRCKLPPVLAEIDRIVRPGGKFIVRDESSTIGEVENLLKSLHWEVSLTVSKNQEGMLSAQKGKWRPNTYADRNSS